MHRTKKIDIPPTKSQNNPVMKPIYSYALLAAFAAVGQALAVDATTTPVGYVSLSIGGTPGNAVPAESDVAVSIPLDRTVEFQGTVASVSGSQITVTGASFGVFDNVAIPHVAKLSSGVRNGLTGLITVNNATSVTIAVPTGDNLTGVVSGDKITIHKAWTPVSVFSTAPPAGTQILAFSGTSPGVNIGVDLIYEFDGTNWIDTNSFDVADNTVLYQGETFLIRNNSLTPIASLVLSGSVTKASNRVVVNNLDPGIGQDNMVAYTGSVGEIIGDSSLASVAVAGDQLLALDNSTTGQNKGFSTIIEFDGTAWIDTNSFDDVTTTFKLQAGVGYTFRRGAAASALDLVWSDVPTYVPTL
jgi:uncharacterized protein (TIGR02597 family)